MKNFLIGALSVVCLLLIMGAYRPLTMSLSGAQTAGNFLKFTGADGVVEDSGTDDSEVMHLAGSETVTGKKTFNGGLTTTGLEMGVQTFDSNDTVGNDVGLCLVDSSSNDVTLTLSDDVAGAIWYFKMTTSPGANTTTIQGESGTIDGSASVTRLNNEHESLIIGFDGTNYHLLANFISVQ